VAIARARIIVCRSATASERAACAAGFPLAAIAREFPAVPIETERGGVGETPASTVDVGAWRDRSTDFAPFDRRVDALAAQGPLTLVVCAEAPEVARRAALEMLTRWQRLIDRRNAASATPCFDALLAWMRAAYDLGKPLVAADYNHALDTWQWLLRLAPEAGAAVQAAALLHDVERLESEADTRVEHLAPSYVAFKTRHARRGAQIARAWLLESAFDEPTAARAAELVAGHEEPGDDAERALLNDADGLSFFSQNSAGYVDYFGEPQTRRKIRYTLGRMRAGARARLDGVRLRADLQRLLEEELGTALEEQPLREVRA
jgi:hypothetical protein